MEKKKFAKLFVEFILLAILLGLVPELVVNAFRDVFGPCGYSTEVCTDIVIMGVYEAIAALFCFILACVLVFKASIEYNKE